MHGHGPPRWLVEQADRLEGPRTPGSQNLLQVAQRRPRVDDVFDDDDVAIGERAVEILEETDLAGARGSRFVAGYRDEVDRHLARHRARQIGREHERPLQHDDEMWLRAVVADALGE